MSSILEHNKVYHYVYYSYEERGRGYIGSRSCNCLPEHDYKYFGSFKDKTFKPTQKVIIFEFKTIKEALEAEIKLHNFYEVHINRHFANRAKQTSTKFSTQGVAHTEEARLNISLGHKGLTHSLETKVKISQAHIGKKVSEETKNKISLANKNKNLGEDNFCFGKFGKDHPRFGEFHSEEAKIKISNSRKENFTGENHPWFGKTHSSETKQKMSELRRGVFIGEKSPCFGTMWYNNGEKSIRIAGSPPPGFTKGRLKVKNTI
jgi:hypothetical protein